MLLLLILAPVQQRERTDVCIVIAVLNLTVQIQEAGALIWHPLGVNWSKTQAMAENPQYLHNHRSY